VEELGKLVARSKSGDLDAYGQIVGRFQDMAFGYAYSILRDFHLAEDAAQEAFLESYRKLESLKVPRAFPGWFRRIVWSRCQRELRKKRPSASDLTAAEAASTKEPGPAEAAEKSEMREAVLSAIRALPDAERTVTTLYYIDGYSHKDIAEFLEAPETTVNNRLHASRKRLKERMVTMVADELRDARPGPDFREKVLQEIAQVEVHPEWRQAGLARGVLLTDKRGRCLLISIGRTEELAIDRALLDLKSPRPLTHDLLLSTLSTFGISLKEVRVVDLVEGTFRGQLVLERSGETRSVDCRPSDGLALAIAASAKITVAEHVMEKAGARDPNGKPMEPNAVWEEHKKKCERHMMLAQAGQGLVRELARLSDEDFKRVVAAVGVRGLDLVLRCQPVTDDPGSPQNPWSKLRQRLRAVTGQKKAPPWTKIVVPISASYVEAVTAELDKIKRKLVDMSLLPDSEDET